MADTVADSDAPIGKADSVPHTNSTVKGFYIKSLLLCTLHVRQLFSGSKDDRTTSLLLSPTTGHCNDH